MTKHLKAVKSSLILAILLLSMTIAFVPTSPVSAKLITFESVLQMTYDQNATKGVDFRPSGPAVVVPITISYKAVAPDIVFNGYIAKILIFGLITPPVPITLTIDNPPPWAAISLVNANPVIDHVDNVFINVSTAIVIAPLENAPAENWFVRVKADAPAVGRGHVQPSTAVMDITFQPGYTPNVDIKTDTPVQSIGPQETATFQITITNNGNKKTLVLASVENSPKGWTILLPNSQITIDAGQSGTMSFSATPPYGFGWHNDYEAITLKFIPEFWPPPPTGDTSQFIGSPVFFQVNVRSRGLSTPGFEVAGAIIGVLLVAFLLNKRRQSQT